MENEKVFSGCIPALMTPCNEKGKPDLNALVLKGKQLINVGMKSVVYCGSMGDWPLLTDEQRQEGVSALIESGIPVIVGTGAQNTLTATLHARHASEIGASGLMIILGYYHEGVLQMHKNSILKLSLNLVKGFHQ